jgi:hypothetical protein
MMQASRAAATRWRPPYAIALTDRARRAPQVMVDDFGPADYASDEPASIAPPTACWSTYTRSWLVSLSLLIILVEAGIPQLTRAIDGTLGL